MAKPRKQSLDLDFDLSGEAKPKPDKFRPKCFGDYDAKVCEGPEFICGEECGKECVETSTRQE
jgi:hypothetical protein